jgi:DNA-binding HxlR family transcriptional regulator
VNRGEFTINGFRNRDLRNHLYDRPTEDAREQRRRSAAITRKLRQLRAHGLIKKVPKTHRYVLTERGREIITSLMAARSATAEILMKAA